MPKVSIIVPIYNSQKYLRKCINSILQQTYRDFELLLIDDGSTDSSAIICKSFFEKDARIRVFHLKNGGVSKARNFGLEKAIGEYIAFCDSDDIVTPNWLESLVYAMHKTQIILPKCCFCTDIEELGNKGQHTKHLELSPKDFYYIEEMGLAGFLWNSLYVKSIIDEYNICFRELSDIDYNEDLIFNLIYLQYIDKAIVINEKNYYYRDNKQSISKQYNQYYYKKYAEKFKLWIGFTEDNPCFRERALVSESNKLLYHAFEALNEESHKLALSNYIFFKSIITDLFFQECLVYSDTSKENERVILLAKQKKSFRLFLLFWMHSKRR